MNPLGSRRTFYVVCLSIALVLFWICTAQTPKNISTELVQPLELLSKLTQSFEKSASKLEKWSVVSSNSGHEASDLLRRSKRISDANGFVFLLFLNDAYLEMTQSWICNVQGLLPDVLKHVAFVATSSGLSKRLQLWNPDVQVFVHDAYSTSTDLSYGNYDYFRLGAERLSLQTELIQNGVNVMVIESDATWYSDKVVDFVRSRLQVHDIVSAADANKIICACFLGIRSTEATRDFFQTYNASYFNTLETFKNSKKYIGDIGEQHTMSKMLQKQTKVKVNWLTQCEYANGKWYDKPDSTCPRPMIVHNNFIIGNDKKVARLKKWKQWFLDDQGLCLSRNTTTS